MGKAKSLHRPPVAMLIPMRPLSASEPQESPPGTPGVEDTISSAMSRYLSETPFQEGNLHGRLMMRNATTGKNRDRVYEERQRTQLNSLATIFSQPERSDLQQFPFHCVFHFAGCEQRFPNKAEWKQHVWAEHLKSHYWLCTQGSCGHESKQLQPLEHACLSPSTTGSSRGTGDHLGKPTASEEVGRVFRRKDLFTQHLLSAHHRDSRNPGDEWHHHVVDSQDSAMRSSSGLPQHLRCPVRGCETVHFHGPTAWKQRLDHAAGHFLKAPQRTGVFGGPADADLVEWAAGRGAALIARARHQGGWVLRGLAKDDAPLTDSGYGGPNGEPAHSSSHSEPGSSVSKNRRQTGEEMVECPLPAGSSLLLAGLPVYDRSTDFSKERSTPLTIFSDDNSEDAESPLPDSPPTSLVSSSGGDAPQQSNIDVEAVMTWFSAWLKERLALEPQQQDAGEGGSIQSESAPGAEGQSAGQDSNMPSQAENWRVVGDGQALKRKRDDDDDGGDDDNRGGTRARDNNSTEKTFEQWLACPFFKFDPHTYGTLRWKSCVGPGWPTVNRIKEHVYRRHCLPKYQCERCFEDLETPEALKSHRRQDKSCDLRTGVVQHGINSDQAKLMRCKKRAMKKKTEKDKWVDMYRIAFPDEAVVPSPYQWDIDMSEIDRIRKYGRFLRRESPPLVRRRVLNGDFGQVEGPACEKIKETFPVLTAELDDAFTKEIGHTVSEAGTEEKAESLNSGGGPLESTEIGANDEGLGADYGVPFSSSNLAGIDMMDENETWAELFNTNWDRDEVQLQDA